MASIITGIFKKNKTGKQLVDLLVDHLNALPTASKIKEVTKKKAEVNEGAVSKEASAVGNTEIGVADGLSPEEIGALDGFQKRLGEIRVMLCGTAESSAKDDESMPLAKALINSNIPMRLVISLPIVTFEARKEIVNIVNYLLAYNKPSQDAPLSDGGEGKNSSPEVSNLAGLISTYFKTNAHGLIPTLLEGFSQPNLALHSGAILRQCLYHRTLYEKCLQPEVLDLFFNDFLHSESFDVCSDAFATFRNILSQQKLLVSKFLEEKYDFFFPRYNKLLQSDMQYVTQRQSLKLLSELLLDRNNYKTMMKYIGDKNNLILVMNLMRVKSPAMRLEAFHVFKIFVANPNKTDAVKQILAKNRTKLIAYLANFTTEREDTNFNSERKLLITTLEALQVGSPSDKPAGNPPQPNAGTAQ